MAKLLKHIIFLGIILMLVLPFVQSTFGIFKTKPLKGSYDLAGKPEFSTRAYFDDEFQTGFNNYIEDHIGFRPYLVRVNNQLAFSLFDTALANWVIIGKKNYLYETNYIKGYLGRDFLGEDSINRILFQVKSLQDTLENHGVHMILTFAPGKASYYPEYIPDRFNPEIKTISNYDYYTQRSHEMGINMLDFNQWFLSMKDTIPYPLVPKCGIHWSLYGVYFALDSLLGYMENLSGQKYMSIHIDTIEISRRYQDTDYDVADGMNLLFKINQGKLAYPKMRFIADSITVKPDVTVIADSYYWNIFGSAHSQQIFDNNNFWYYFQQAHNPEFDSVLHIEDFDLKEEILKQDFIIILASETNLYRYGFGFFEKAGNLFNCQN